MSKIKKFEKNYYTHYKNWANVQYVTMFLTEDEKFPKTFKCMIYLEVNPLIKPDKEDIGEIQKLFEPLLKVDDEYICAVLGIQTTISKDALTNVISVRVLEEQLEVFVKNFEINFIEVLNIVINFKSSIPNLNNRMNQLGFILK